jgi:hypothetical protein
LFAAQRFDEADEVPVASSEFLHAAPAGFPHPVPAPVSIPSSYTALIPFASPKAGPSFLTVHLQEGRTASHSSLPCSKVFNKKNSLFMQFFLWLHLLSNKKLCRLLKKAGTIYFTCEGSGISS